ncbi:MAG TPA: polysaccharide biosynthesis/export family protein [Acidobacteriaceae bacterium]|nr:polysaccharide biosynthesis/export family protein [Acidobacteriaceae bacterium]
MTCRLITLAGLVAAAAITATAQGVAAQDVAARSASEIGPPSAAAGPARVPGFQERNPRYRLRRGDTFDLDFAMTPEFNQVVAIQPDGYITLKGAGSVFVEGQTVPELTETLKTAYANILHDPIIAVSLKDFEKPYFIASGEVAKPGKYDLRSDLTVTEAVAIAGGFDDKSKHSQVVLFRPAPGGGFEAKLINVKKLLASRNLSEDVRLQPGDMLYVPQNALSKIRPFLPTSGVSAYLGPGIL